MDINEFIEHFAEQFEDTNSSEFKAETIFKDLDEWSSLMALNIIAMVDEEYDVTLKGADIEKSTTIKDLFNTVQSKK
ncbi:phosphopantetheine-binding protein [Fibrobacter sp.]|uniref:phosphopantetheine-binding protein n=1 Tax=Fibrobacter sp. TaxID=35828 RepID=UPI003864619D